jgi:hypothetical protein
MIRSEPSLSNYSFPSGPNVSESTTTPQNPRYPDSTQTFRPQASYSSLVGIIKGRSKGVWFGKRGEANKVDSLFL